MPLEMYLGKNGKERVIARRPVTEGSYATVTVRAGDGRMYDVQLVVTDDKTSSGWPALTPIESTLPPSIGKSLKTRRLALTTQLNAAYRQLAKAQAAFAMAGAPSETTDGVFDGISLERSVMALYEQVVVPRVVCGEAMHLIASRLGAPYGWVRIGEVTAITFNNPTGHAPTA